VTEAALSRGVGPTWCQVIGWSAWTGAALSAVDSPRLLCGDAAAPRPDRAESGPEAPGRGLSVPAFVLYGPNNGTVAIPTAGWRLI
jgi:hypothetical protein